MQSSQQTSFFDDHTEKKQGPVECLGMTFENDEARRAYFTESLREKLQDQEFRKIEGFPIGEDEDILRLSDPPYYTACPNPFLPEVLAEWQRERLAIRARLGLPEQAEQREPFAADVSEGKNDPIYNAHSYHTKVPHKAIMRYILHYTEPGDIVFDGFCGTGMTGVAAQQCGSRKEVEALGYRVDEHGVIWDGQKAISHLGVRKAVLNDLSPAATFIAFNYNMPVSITTFEREARQMLQEVEQECGWMYETFHTDGSKRRINYTVWSEFFLCPHCSTEIVYFDVAVDKDTFEVKDKFQCPGCKALLDKKSLQREWVAGYDEVLQHIHSLVKYVPVLINYQVGSKRFEKRPDAYDLGLIQRIQETPLQDEYPMQEMPDGERKGKDGYDLKGISHLHHFYFRRALLVYARLWQKASSHPDQAFVRFFVQGNCLGFTRMNRYSANHYSQVNRYFSGTLFVGSLISEVSPAYSMTHKLERLSKLNIPGRWGQSAITCQSTTSLLSIPENTFDYVFVDPPFGNNLHYSELNFFWEAWLKLLTQREPEAVMDKERHRTLLDYQGLMTRAFQEIYRVVKPGRWMTVEFHNSKNSVWNAIQEAMQRAGFVVADVRTLDKQQETYKQSIQKLVKQDLVITAYKPNERLEERFKLKAGSEEVMWDFIQDHLHQLPVAVEIDGRIEIIVERMDYLLFDRMVAFHVQRGIFVPMSSAEFYAGLAQRFPERDGMYFLTDQVGKYDQARLQAHQVQQLQLFVNDESSAILWLRHQLETHPQTYQDLFPKFIREISAWEKHEKALELSEILEQNFLSFDGAGPIPEQIWSWMQRDEDLHSAVKGQSRENPPNHLRALAKGCWFVPDSNNSYQLEKVREKALLKEFDSYKGHPGKKLKVFRLEAVRAGFKKAWQDRDYKTIIAVAEKISEDALQQDPKTLMWFDQALTRMKQ